MRLYKLILSRVGASIIISTAIFSSLDRERREHTQQLQPKLLTSCLSGNQRWTTKFIKREKTHLQKLKGFSRDFFDWLMIWRVSFFFFEESSD